MITTNYSINYASQIVPEIIPAVQGDTGRTLIFTPADFTLPDGVTATYYVQKPSGEAVYDTAIISDGKITCALTAQALAEVGENKLQVRVLNGEDIVTSFSALLIVHPFEGIGAIKSTTEINIFDQAVEAAKEEINATIESAETALAEAVEEAIIEVHENALAFYVTDEASGAIATFPDGADLVPVKSLTVEIEPVQSGSGDPSPTNVRPITGWTQAKVTRTGKNLLKVTATSDTVQGVTFTVNSDGTVLANGSVVGGNNINFLLGYVNLPTAKNLTINGAPSGATASTYYLAALNGTMTQEIGQDTGSGADLGSRQSVAVRIRILTGTTLNNVLFKPMIRFTSDADATFEPFGDVFTIDLSGTRYGGTLDVVTGVLTVDKAMVDLGSLTWTYDSGLSRFESTVISDMKPSAARTGYILSDRYQSIMDGRPSGNVPNASIYTVIEKKIFVVDNGYSSAADFKTAVTGSPAIYPLATPLTVQLTAEQVTTLLGQNCIFADCGDVTCQYRADTKLYIDKILNA